MDVPSRLAGEGKKYKEREREMKARETEKNGRFQHDSDEGKRKSFSKNGARAPAARGGENRNPWAREHPFSLRNAA